MSLSPNFHAHLSAVNHRHVSSSASTNSELIAALQSEMLDVYTVHLLTADTQTAGRGQRDRSWQSPRGNVYLSLYHPIHVPVSGLLSLVIGLELAKMPVIQTLNKQLHAQGLTPIGVKWANDLGFYQSQKPLSGKDFGHSAEIDESNKTLIHFNKLAGILIEPVWHSGNLVGVVMGVGLNVQATPALTTQTCESMSYQAISLQDSYQSLSSTNTVTPNDLSEQKISSANNAESFNLPILEILYQQISQALFAAIACFEQLANDRINARTIGSQTNTTDDFMQQFATMDALAGLHLRVTQNHNSKSHIITGHACGIDTNGCLQLRQDNGKISALFTGRIDVIGDK